MLGHSLELGHLYFLLRKIQVRVHVSVTASMSASLSLHIYVNAGIVSAPVIVAMSWYACGRAFLTRRLIT